MVCFGMLEENLVLLPYSWSLNPKLHESNDLSMRHILSLALAALIALFALSVVAAADVAHGEQVFTANCAACHMGGGNVVNGTVSARSNRTISRLISPTTTMAMKKPSPIR